MGDVDDPSWHPIRKGWEQLKRAGWLVRRGLEHALDVTKWVVLVTIGLFGFLPVPESMRAAIERLFLRGPIKSPDLSSQKDEALKRQIHEISFNMGQFQDELRRTTLGFDPERDNVRLHAWYMPGKKDKPCIVYSHGRGSNVSHHEGLLKSWMERGYGVLIYDYPNFGRSQGKATEVAFYKSGLAAALYAQKNLAIPVANQVLMGNSLGSAVSAQMVEHLKALGQQPRAVALISTFPSIKEAFVFNRNKFGWLGKLLNEKRISVKLNVAEALEKNTEVPVLVLQGKEDKRTPVSMIQDMLEHMKNPASRKQVQLARLPKLQHCLKDSDFPPLVEETARFLEKTGPAKGQLQTTV